MNRKAKNQPSLLERLQVAKALLTDGSTLVNESYGLVDDIDSLQSNFINLKSMTDSDARYSCFYILLLDLIQAVHSFLLRHEHDLESFPCNTNRWTGNATWSLIDRLRRISQYVTTSFPTDTLSMISTLRKQTIPPIKVSFMKGLCKKTRLHAEIQLILYFEHEAAGPRPRVICSSTSACYLYQLVIKVHGGFLIPSTHGKLYDTWKWLSPPPPFFNMSLVKPSVCYRYFCHNLIRQSPTN